MQSHTHIALHHVLVALVLGVELLGALLIVGLFVKHLNEAVDHLDLVLQVFDFAVVCIDHLLDSRILLQGLVELGLHSGDRSVEVHLLLLVLFLDGLELPLLIFVLSCHRPDLVLLVLYSLLELLHYDRQLLQSLPLHNVDGLLCLYLLVELFCHFAQTLNAMLSLVLPYFFIRGDFFLVKDRKGFPQSLILRLEEIELLFKDRLFAFFLLVRLLVFRNFCFGTVTWTLNFFLPC